MLLLTLASVVSVASAQTFSIGIGLGRPGDVIPAFDSQRSSSATTSSSQNRNPFTSFSGAGGSDVNFEKFFSSSRVASPQSSPDTRTRSQERTPSRSPARTFPEAPASTSSTSSATAPGRSSSSFRGISSPNPVITSRGAPVAPVSTPVVSSPARETTKPTFSSQLSGAGTTLPRDSSSFKGSFSQTPPPSRPRGGAFEGSRDFTVQASRDVSSRGREQDAVPRQPSATRPPTTTETNEVVDPRDNLIGHSICARGSIGDACRKHLANTAMSCTSGFCHECQQCGNMSPDLWPKCCREHFLCCRPLARACQGCDQPALKPFCSVAFGRALTKAVTETVKAVTETVKAVTETVKAVTETVKAVTETVKAVTETVKAVTETVKAVTETVKAVTETVKAVTETVKAVNETVKAVTETVASRIEAPVTSLFSSVKT
ncbi:hypothetical protein FHG87_016641 [Trinorchestia longiramus]|nr:hypothetical protein FHG87_016641 [Trinorchestia longiramus]